MSDLVGYEIFIPDIAAAIHGKKKKDLEVSKSRKVLEMGRRSEVAQLTDDELKLVISTIFLSAMIKFMKDSKLYRKEIPIDIYSGITIYDIIPPEGFMVDTVVGLIDNRAVVPENISFTIDSLSIPCCPAKDIRTAFILEVALVVKRSSGVCKFDSDFVDRYYDAILNQMFVRLYSMNEREWHSTTRATTYKRDYLTELNRARRESRISGNKIKIRKKRLSSYE